MKKRLIAITFALLVAIVTSYLCAELPAPSRHVATLFAVAVSLWITEVIPLWLTAIVAPGILVALGAFSLNSYLRAFGSEVILLFIGSFVIARAISLSGLDKRIAFATLSVPALTKTPARLLATLGALSCALSLLMSSTAVTAMMLPVGLTILATLKERPNSPLSIAVLLMLTWGSSVAVGFLIATPPNVIAQSYIATEAQVRIGFGRWMIFGMPITLAMLTSAWLILCLRYGGKAKIGELVSAEAKNSLKKLGLMTRSERTLVVVLVLTLTLWVSPDLILMFANRTATVRSAIEYLSPANIALFSAGLLLLLPASDSPSGRILSLKDAAKISWGTIALFGGGIALGRASFESGLAGLLAENLKVWTAGQGLFGVTAIATFASVILSELSSNTAAATLSVPLAMTVATASGVSSIAPALGAGIGASLGFMMPISTPPNAIIYSSGRIPAVELMKSGVILDLVGGVTVVLTLRLMLPLCGLW